MSFEGQKQGFARMKPRSIVCRSGIPSALLWPAHQVGNPMIITILEMSVSPIKKTATIATEYELSVE